MNLNCIINMVIRSVVRQVTNRGIKAGFDALDNRNKTRPAARGQLPDEATNRRNPDAPRDDA